MFSLIKFPAEFGSPHNGLAMPIISQTPLLRALFIPSNVLNPPVTIKGMLTFFLIFSA